MSIKCTCRSCGAQLELPNSLTSSASVKVEPKYTDEGYQAYSHLEGLLSLLKLLSLGGASLEATAEREELWATFSVIEDLTKTAVGKIYK